VARLVKVAGSIPDEVIELILWPHSGPGFDSASSRNETHGYLLEVNVAGA
jgi:hypothetical protein